MTKKKYFIFLGLAALVIFSLLMLSAFQYRNQRKESHASLYEQQEILKSNFEKIYSFDNYCMYSEDDKIIVELTGFDCHLTCYFDIEKNFIESSIVSGLFVNNYVLDTIIISIVMLCLTFILLVIIILLYLVAQNFVISSVKTILKQRH